MNLGTRTTQALNRSVFDIRLEILHAESVLNKSLGAF